MVRTPPLTLRFLASLVARFGPQWNSPDDDKTRFFKILAVADNGGSTVLLLSCRPAAVPDHGRNRSTTRDNDSGAAGRRIRGQAGGALRETTQPRNNAPTVQPQR